MLRLRSCEDFVFFRGTTSVVRGFVRSPEVPYEKVGWPMVLLPGSGPKILLIAGIAGTGKSTVGKFIADQLRWMFIDADDFHTVDAVRMMDSGMSVTDQYRDLWIAEVIGAAKFAGHEDRNCVVACSCLKRRHREQLRRAPHQSQEGGVLRIAWINVPQEELRRRLTVRKEQEGHFFPPSLLDAQLESMEIPDVTEEPEVSLFDGTLDPLVLANAIWERFVEIHAFPLPHISMVRKNADG